MNLLSYFKIQKPFVALMSVIGIATAIGPSVALAEGGQDGGGGGAVRCRKVAKDEVQVFRAAMIDGQMVYYREPRPSALENGREYQLLDLWEAQYGYGPFRHNKKTLVASAWASERDLIEKSLTKLASVNAEFAQQVRESESIVSQRNEAISASEYILPPNDTDVRYMPKGCKIVGFGSYWDSKEKFIYDPEVYDNTTVPNLDRAALRIHEAVYRILRKAPYNDKNSWRARRITGLMFSEEPFTWSEALHGYAEDK